MSAAKDDDDEKGDEEARADFFADGPFHGLPASLCAPWHLKQPVIGKDAPGIDEGQPIRGRRRGGTPRGSRGRRSGSMFSSGTSALPSKSIRQQAEFQVSLRRTTTAWMSVMPVLGQIEQLLEIEKGEDEAAPVHDPGEKGRGAGNGGDLIQQEDFAHTGGLDRVIRARPP